MNISVGLHQQIYEDFLKEVENLWIWPISHKMLEDPIILENGNSISRSEAEKSINSSEDGGFDKESKIVPLIPNVMGSKLWELYNDLNQKLAVKNHELREKPSDKEYKVSFVECINLNKRE